MIRKYILICGFILLLTSCKAALDITVELGQRITRLLSKETDSIAKSIDEIPITQLLKEIDRSQLGENSATASIKERYHSVLSRIDEISHYMKSVNTSTIRIDEEISLDVDTLSQFLVLSKNDSGNIVGKTIHGTRNLSSPADFRNFFKSDHEARVIVYDFDLSEEMLSIAKNESDIYFLLDIASVGDDFFTKTSIRFDVLEYTFPEDSVFLRNLRQRLPEQNDESMTPTSAFIDYYETPQQFGMSSMFSVPSVHSEERVLLYNNTEGFLVSERSRYTISCNTYDLASDNIFSTAGFIDASISSDIIRSYESKRESLFDFYMDFTKQYIDAKRAKDVASTVVFVSIPVGSGFTLIAINQINKEEE